VTATLFKLDEDVLIGVIEKSLSSAVLALKSPVKDIYLYDLEKFLISKSMSLNAS
jgi:hypothetical protein